MDVEEYEKLLGPLLGNLQSLEFLLRGYLYEVRNPPHYPLPAGTSLDTLVVGQKVPENALTCYDSLGNLIDRYNAQVPTTHRHLVVDRSVVELRDAFAHGRVSAPDPSGHLVLLKFDRPSAAGTTTVTHSQELTPRWLADQAGRVAAEATKVAQAPGWLTPPQTV